MISKSIALLYAICSAEEACAIWKSFLLIRKEIRNQSFSFARHSHAALPLQYILAQSRLVSVRWEC
jgi:hypothetical protein